MPKLWLVARYEFVQHLYEKGFILTLIGVPALIAVTIGLAALVSSLNNNDRPIGYVDHAAFLARPLLPIERAGSPGDPSTSELVPVRAFDSEDVAQAALEAQEIQVYYIIPADYGQTNLVQMIYLKEPGSNARNQFWDMMKLNQLRDVDLDAATRAVAGSELIVRWPNNSPTGGREFSEDTFLSQFVPLMAGLAFIIIVFMSSNYLMQAVVIEKENRTMEVVVTSISPSELIIGKVFGIMALTITQMVAWIACIALMVLIGGHVFGLGILSNLRIVWAPLIQIMLVGIPSYVLVAGLLTAVGATVAETQEAQGFSGMIMLPMTMPMWLAVAFIENSSGPLALGLSLFPLTSLATFSLRMTFGSVPAWQIAASVAINSVTAAIMLWIAGRAFRLGMLRFGQRLRLGEILGRHKSGEGAQA